MNMGEKVKICYPLLPQERVTFFLKSPNTHLSFTKKTCNRNEIVRNVM